MFSILRETQKLNFLSLYHLYGHEVRHLSVRKFQLFITIPLYSYGAINVKLDVLNGKLIKLVEYNESKV